MTVLEAYKKYQISQSLQLHQLRVAAVARQICDNLTTPVDTAAVVTACLIHDMGNILKFVPDVPAEWFAPQGVDYWMRVKQQTIQKYNTQDEHELSLIIARQIGVSDKVLACVDSIDFRKTIQTVSGPDIEPKICDYADLRVSPNGVVSLEERLEEGNRRYKNRPDKWLADDVRQAIIQACHDNETQIFKNCRIKAADITNESVAPLIEQLKSYEIGPPKV